MATAKIGTDLVKVAATNFITNYAREFGKNAAKKNHSEKKSSKLDIKPAKDTISIIAKEYDNDVLECNINNISTIALTGIIALGGTALSLAIFPQRIGALVFALSGPEEAILAYNVSKPIIALTGAGGLCYYNSNLGLKKLEKEEKKAPVQPKKKSTKKTKAKKEEGDK